MFRYARILMVVSFLVFTVGCGNDQTATPPAVSISVSPTTPSVDVGLTQQFSATVGNTSDTAVSWSAGGVAGGNATVGTIDAAGLYTAPATLPDPATVTITATSAADASKTATATVTVTDIQVSVSPSPVTVSVGQTQQFTATVTGGTSTVSWSVNGVAGGDATLGMIDASGLYTAPAVAPDPDTITITAASTVNPAKTATADATVSIGPVIAGTVSKGPLNSGTIKVFSVNSNGSNGTQLASGVTNSSGAFSVVLPAPQAGPVRVVASGGTYKSEATGGTVTGTSDISSLIDSVTSNVSGLAVTPLSNLVSTLTRRRLSGGGGSLRKGRAIAAVSDPSTEHAAANSAVAKFFGLSGASPIETLHPKFGKSDITADPDGFKVGLATATLALEGAALLPGSPDDLLGALANDLSDGVFDGHDDTGAAVPLGDGSLPPTAGTTDFLTSLNNCVTNCTTITENGITSSDVSGEVSDLSAGVSTSSLTPSAVGLAAGSSGAIGSMSFGGRQYVFIAARTNGIAVVDVTNPAAPTAKMWPSVYSNLFGNQSVGGVIPVLGIAAHPQVLAFAYGSKHVALLNAQVLATGTPGTDDAALIDTAAGDFQGDLPLVGGIVSFSGGSAYIAGGIPDNGRKGVWLATTDGYAFFDLLTNTLGTTYPVEATQQLAENVGGDIAHNLLLGSNYYGFQIIDLLAGKSYAGDTTVFPTFPDIDGNSVDSGYQVGIFTFEDVGQASFLNLATITKADGVSGAPNTFAPGADGFVNLTFDNTLFPVFSGSAVDSSSHLALFMAGYSQDMGVGLLQDPASAAPGAWTGLSDWATYHLYDSTALGSYCSAADPHAVGVVYNLAAGKPYGYLLDGCTARAIQIDMAGFLALPRAGTTGDAGHEIASGTDPAAPGGPLLSIPFAP